MTAFLEQLDALEEEVYLQDDETPREAMQGLATCFVRYSERRQHQSRAYHTPAAVYCGRGVAHSILSSWSFFCLQWGTPQGDSPHTVKQEEKTYAAYI